MARISQKQHFDALPGCSLQWSSFARSDYFISRGVDRIRLRETHRAKNAHPPKKNPPFVGASTGKLSTKCTFLNQKMVSRSRPPTITRSTTTSNTSGDDT